MNQLSPPNPGAFHYLVTGGSGSLGGRHLESRGYLRINYACQGDPEDCPHARLCGQQSMRGGLLNQVAGRDAAHTVNTASTYDLANLFYLAALSIRLLTSLLPSIDPSFYIFFLFQDEYEYRNFG